MSRPTTLMIAVSRTRIGGLTKVTFLENETSRRCERLSIPSTVYRVLSCSSVGFRSCSQYLAAGRSLCSDRPARLHKRQFRLVVLYPQTRTGRRGLRNSHLKFWLTTIGPWPKQSHSEH